MKFSIELIKEESWLKSDEEIELWYNRYIKLIEYSKNQDYTNNRFTHVHHILPRSMFPQFEKEQKNLIRLSYRLHYLAHFILLKLTNDPRMAIAFSMMNKKTNNKEFYLNSRLFEAATKNITESFINNPSICTPSKLFWTIDENGNRCRTEDESKKISGVAPWQKGFNKINKETTRFMNLITKKIDFVDKLDKPEYFHFRLGTHKTDYMPIYFYKDTYYIRQGDVPEELNFNVKLTFDTLDNVIPTIDSYLYKHRKNKISEGRRKSIEENGGKTLREMGLQMFNFYDPDFKFDFSYKIACFEERNQHL